MMSPTFRALLWIEWRERRWPLTLAAGWMAVVVWNVLEIGARNFYDGTLFFAVGAPVFVALRTALGETADGTRSFSEALPTTRWQRGGMRLAGGAVVIVLPIVLAAGAVIALLPLGWTAFEVKPYNTSWAEWKFGASAPFGVSATQILLSAAILISSAMTLYLLLALTGTALQTPAQLGYVGTAMAMLWGLAILAKPLLTGAGLPLAADSVGTFVPHALYVDNNFMDTLDRLRGGPPAWLFVAGQLAANWIVQGVLCTVFVRRYGQVPAHRGTIQRQFAGRTIRLQPPLVNRATALAWLVLRQSIPLALPGLAIAFVMAGALVVVNRDVPGLPNTPAGYLPECMQIVALLWSTVVGAWLFADEAAGRVREFWRSRPIRPAALFVAKFVSGLVAVVTVLDGAVLAFGWNSPHFGEYQHLSWPYLGVNVPLHATLYSVAVAMACLLRWPTLGAFLALASLMAVTSVIWRIDPAFVPWALHSATLPQYSADAAAAARRAYPFVVGAQLVVMMVAALVAARALDAHGWRRAAPA